jgi:hypothetical protein
MSTALSETRREGGRKKGGAVEQKSEGDGRQLLKAEH